MYTVDTNENVKAYIRDLPNPRGYVLSWDHGKPYVYGLERDIRHLACRLNKLIELETRANAVT